MRFGFIGAGKLGSALGCYFSDHGLAVSGYVSRSGQRAAEAAIRTGSRPFDSLAHLVAQSDAIFLTVPDDAISPVWQSLSELPLTGKLFCHCSGSLSSDILTGAAARGAGACSLHPLMAVPEDAAASLLGQAVFALEGESPFRDRLRTILAGLGNRVFLLDKDQKAGYHCAAVLVSNLATALAHAGAEILRAQGIDDPSGLFRLMAQNAGNIAEHGTVKALTGPVERGDAETIRRHLDSLDGDDRDLYRLLSRKLISLAQTRHPDRDFAPLRAVLGDE